MEQSEASSLTKRVKRNEFSLGLSTLDTVVSTLKHRRDYSKTLENRQLYDVSRVRLLKRTKLGSCCFRVATWNRCIVANRV